MKKTYRIEGQVTISISTLVTAKSEADVEAGGEVVPPCRACESAAIVAGAPPELLAAFAGASWVAAFLDGVGAGARGAASVEAARAGLCETHQKVGDIICDTIAVLAGTKAETLPAPPEETVDGGVVPFGGPWPTAARSESESGPEASGDER